MRINYLIVTAAIIIAGCSTSNKISNSWKNPEATMESAKFQTVAVFGMVKNQDMRMDVEEVIASQMVNTIAVPSYKLITSEQLGDISTVKKLLTDRGMEGVLILSVKRIDEKTTYSSYGMYPSAYYNFEGYYNYASNYMYDPYLYTNTNIYVDLEILIYSLKSDKLIWYGESTSVNPKNIQETIAELAVSVKEQLIEDGLLDPAL